MRSLVSGVVGLIALPVLVVVLVALAVAVITGGATDLTEADRVNGYTLDDLQEMPAYSISPSSAEHIATEARAAHRFTTAGELPAVAGKTFLTDESVEDTVDFYDDALTTLGWEPVNVPDELSSTFSETIVATWNRANLYFRVAFLESDRVDMGAYGRAYHFQLSPITPASDE